MKLSRRGGFHALLLVLVCVPLTAGAQNTAPPTQVPAPADTPKKVWTNENMRSIRGDVPLAGSSGSRASANEHRFDSTSNGGTFVNPKPGQVVNPGETLHVDVAIDSGITLLRGAGIMGPASAFSEIREAPPYSFTLKIPDKDSGGSGPLIGLRTLYAIGAVAGRKNELDLATTTIDVEEPELPVSMFATGNMMGNHNSGVDFFEAGYEEWIRIYGRFPNGHELDVTQSEYFQLATSEPNVVRVAEEGSVISIGAGDASIIATYTLNGQQEQLFIPVSVKLGYQALVALPATVDFGDIPVGTTSPSRQVTITNHSSNEAKIYTVNYFMGPENCSNRVLAPGQSCTLTVSLSLNSRGLAHQTILIDSLPVTLLGNGI